MTGDRDDRDVPARDDPARTAGQAAMFANRLEKRWRHLRKWARREGVSCYRLYDRDIPEVPLACDLYEEDETGNAFLHIALYERPYEKELSAEEAWLDAMRLAAADVLGVPGERVFTKLRRRQRGEDAQYERVSARSVRVVVREGGSRFLVNLSDYLDTGLFLDHRPARLMVRAEAERKRVLNLFCYTGAFSVHAGAGGARAVTSVDLSKTYLAWAGENLALNGLDVERNPLVHADVRAFLSRARSSGERWDLVVLDPPTFSNSKRAPDSLDVNRDWPELCRSALAVLSPGGAVLFSTNSRTLRFDPALIGGAIAREGSSIEDLSEASVPEDFRNRRAHRLWRLEPGT